MRRAGNFPTANGLPQLPSPWAAPFNPPAWARDDSPPHRMSSLTPHPGPFLGMDQPYAMPPRGSPFVPFIPPSLGNVQPFVPRSSAPTPILPPPPPPVVSPSPPTMTPPPPPPIIHQGIICDMCDKIVEGVRHKCLDCPGTLYNTHVHCAC
jgi:hypothetical protein